MDNPLVTTLRIIDVMISGPTTAGQLQERFTLTRPTLMRHIAEARLLGAKIEATQAKRQWSYELRNADEVRVRTRRWLELEETRDVRRAQGVIA